ncbi:uncharacterized protein LOC144477544 [Augochlora pura]
MDYGCIIYSSAKASSLKPLDIIHNSALRIATGAFRTSPVSSIAREAQEPSLHYRRKWLSITQAIKIAATNQKPIFTTTFRNQRNPNFPANRQVPFSERFKNIESELNVNLQPNEVFQNRFANFPPWILHPISTNIDLEIHNKKDTNPQHFKTLTLEFLNKFPQYTQIFTDGSVSKAGSGYATVSEGIINKEKLPQNTSILTAETIAIQQAFKIAANCSNEHYIILSDSKNAILSVTDKTRTDDLTLDILETNHEATEKGKKIILAWIPSHVGIFGNNQADTAAKEATTLSPPRITHKTTPADLQKVFKKRLLSHWNNEWKHFARPHALEVHEGFLKEISITANLNRQQQVAINRIRIGHSKLTHSFLISKTSPPLCDICNSQITIKHILLNCSMYTELRAKYKMKLNSTITLITANK